MLGSTPLTAILGAGIDNTDHDAVRAFIRQAADAGLSLMFIYPGTKAPADMRTSRQRNADDKAAREVAREEGRRGWQKVQSPSGLALATSDKTVLDRYLKAYIQTFSTWRDMESGEEVQWTKKAEDADAIIMTAPAAVNLAIEVGGSGVVVVDCDSKGQVDRFFDVAEIPEADRPAPTILTPGSIGNGGDADDQSTWSHSDGGHFYFTVPEGVELPRTGGSLTWGGDDGFAVLWDRHYVLVPPSTRPEGRYEQLGDDYPLPDFLREAIVKYAERREERIAKAEKGSDNPDLADAVDEWAESVTWQAILEPLGWTPAPRPDSCGCPVWTGPGNHQSPKSATAHEGGCTAGRYTERNAPLHMWTDNPDEPFASWIAEHHTKTISKLQAVAIAYFGGNIGKAMDELELTPDNTVDDPDIERKTDPDAGETADTDGDFDMPTPEPTAAERAVLTLRCSCGEVLAKNDPALARDGEDNLWHDDADGGHRVDTGYDSATQPDEPAAQPYVDPADLPDDFGKTSSSAGDAGPQDSPYSDTVEDNDPDVFDPTHLGVPRIAPFSHWRDMPPPEYVIEGLIEHGGLSCIIGAPGVGKSTIALDMACHIATGKRWRGRRTLKTKVLYLPGEGLSGAVQRLRAWEAAHEVDLSRDLLLGDSIIQVKAANEAWGEIAAYVARQGIGLVIFDTFARMASGLEENSATDVGTAVRRFDKLKTLTNSGVFVVHHIGKGDPNSGRGSSALNGALDSELLVRGAQWDTTDIADDDGRTDGKPLELLTTKQKNAEQIEQPIQLMMKSAEEGWGIDAPIITGPTGTIDPMEGDVIMARPLPEPIVETAIRIRDYLDNLTQQGATRTDLVLAIRPDPYASSRNDTRPYWKQRIGEAVDRALRYDLIQTLTGTPSGSRYIPSAATREGARVAAAAEIAD